MEPKQEKAAGVRIGAPPCSLKTLLQRPSTLFPLLGVGLDRLECRATTQHVLTGSNQPKETGGAADGLPAKLKTPHNQKHMQFASKAQFEAWMGSPPQRPRTVSIDKTGARRNVGLRAAKLS